MHFGEKKCGKSLLSATASCQEGSKNLTPSQSFRHQHQAFKISTRSFSFSFQDHLPCYHTNHSTVLTVLITNYQKDGCGMYYPPSFHDPKAQGQRALATGVLTSRELKHALLCSSDAFIPILCLNNTLTLVNA